MKHPIRGDSRIVEGNEVMELILEAGDCNHDADYAFEVVKEVARLRDIAPDNLDLLLKVQMYRPETITARHAPRYDNTSGDALNQWELFKGALSYKNWHAIKIEADERGVPMFASVFDHQAVEAAVGMGMTRLKIASGDVTYLHLINHAIQAMRRVKGQVYISTGAADYDDLAELLQLTEDHAGALGFVNLMACHLAYPTAIEDANLARVGELRHATNGRYPIGYSDHTPAWVTHVLPLLVGAGAHCWERHFTLTPGKGGDHDFAVAPENVEGIFKQYETIREVMGSPNLTPTAAEAPARELARRGLYAKTDISKGDTLTMGNIAVLRPEKGAKPANELGKYLGKKSPKSVVQGDPI